MVKKEQITFLPNSPGCYLFKNSNGEILYVGKAKDLKKRVSSYFQKKDLDPKTADLVMHIADIDIFTTTNEVEALLLENNLIKKYYPKYNLDLKDSRKYAYILLHQGDLPWLEVVRARDEKGEYFGPFVSGAIRKLILDVLTRNFRVLTRQPNRALKKTIDKEIYSKRVAQAREILKGNVDSLISELKAQMNLSSSKTYYEHALTLKNQIQALKTLKERQLIEMTRAVDAHIINYSILGDSVYLLLFTIRKGVLEDKQAYNFSYYEDFFEDFLIQYYDYAPIPQELIIPHQIDEAFGEYLSKKSRRSVSIIVPQRGDKKDLLDLVAQNITTTFFAGSDRITALQEILNTREKSPTFKLEYNLSISPGSHKTTNKPRLKSRGKNQKGFVMLEKLPKSIECFDISHLGGTNTVASMVSFYNGLPDKLHYRKFKIRNPTQGDDYFAMKEVILRRYSGTLIKSMKNPDLIVVDGGLPQLGAALSSLRQLNLKIPVISLAKKFEEIYVPNRQNPIVIDRKNKGLQLLQSMRDEAHRFAITFQRLLRSKEILRKE